MHVHLTRKNKVMAKKEKGGKKTKFFPFILDVARVDQRNPYNRVDRSGRKDRSVDLKNGFIDFFRSVFHSRFRSIK